MIFKRSIYGEEVLFHGRAYDCDYEWIKIDDGKIMGSDDKSTWHQLRGRTMLSFDNQPKPDIVMVKPKQYDPMEF